MPNSRAITVWGLPRVRASWIASARNSGGYADFRVVIDTPVDLGVKAPSLQVCLSNRVNFTHGVDTFA